MIVTSDPAIPPPSELFRLTTDLRGPRLAIVFGNQASLGLCPFAKAGICHHCDIGLGEGTQFDAEMNARRLRWFKNHYAAAFQLLSHLVVYNSGSTLNPEELSLSVLDSLLSYVRTLPNLKVVSLDSRENFIIRRRITRLASSLGKGRELRIILGLESANDRIRNEILEKRMSKLALESAVRTIASANEHAGHTTGFASLGVSFNVIIGGPGTTSFSAISDALETSVYSVELAEKYNLPIDLNLNPYYPSRRAITRFPDHPRASLTLLREATCAIRERIQDRAVLFIGWHDEGHDQEQDLRLAEATLFSSAIDSFNKTGKIAHLLRAF